MKYPTLKEGVAKQYTIEALRGGCNLRDGAQCTADTQLLEANNLWWQNGALRTRPAFFGMQAQVKTVQNTDVSFLFCGEDTTHEQSGARRFLRRSYDRSVKKVTLTLGIFTFDGVFAEEGSLKNLPADTVAYALTYPYSETENVLIFVSNGEIYAQNTKNYQWRNITNLAYTPCVLQNGQGYRKQSYAFPFPPTPNYEARNLLSDSFCAKYSTSSKDTVYFAPYEALDETKQVQVSYIDENGWTYGYTVEAGESCSQPDERGVYLLCDRMDGMFCLKHAASDTNLVMADGLQNNLVLYAYQSRSEEVKRLLASMQFSTWMGGAQQGYAARLFCGGASAASNRIYWSAPGNPLYMPDSNYISMGDTSQAVTALGKQDGKLIIFKERELYCLSDFTNTVWAKDSNGEKVADADFLPLTQLHGQIGTLAPHTICFCGNRLCWADGLGSVYTLIESTDGYTVHPLSSMVESALQTHDVSVWKNAHAAEFQGHYLLAVGKTVYVLRIDEKAFKRYTSVYNDTSAQQQLAWYVWQVPFDLEMVFFGGNGRQAAMLTQNIDVNSIKLIPFTLKNDGADVVFQGDVWSEHPIVASFSTKLYDFDDAVAFKRVIRLYGDFEADAGALLRVSYQFDDTKTEESTCYTVPNGTLVLSPPVTRARRFGWATTFFGRAGLSGLSVVYRRGK